MLNLFHMLPAGPKNVQSGDQNKIQLVKKRKKLAKNCFID